MLLLRWWRGRKVGRRMKRHLFTVVAAMSLLLCLATMAVWMRSFWISSFWGFDEGGRAPAVVLFSDRGRVGVATSHVIMGVPLIGWEEWPDDKIGHGSSAGWKYLGFDMEIEDTTAFSGDLQIVVPDWFICATFAVAPCRWLWLHHRKRRAKLNGLCITCGYDLRASPERCPECGTVVPEAKA